MSATASTRRTPLSGLRRRLTFLYLLAGLLLVGLLGAGAYFTLARSFELTVDAALDRRLTDELRGRSLTVPPQLAPAPDRSGRREEGRRGRGREDDHDGFDAELAAVFVLTVRPDGQVVAPTVTGLPEGLPDQAAVGAAVSGQLDRRTVQLPDAGRVRLLSYRVDPPLSAEANRGVRVILQVGRSLSDQDQSLAAFVGGLLGIGAVSVVVLGLGSWWLAGRTIAPAQQAWERQQAFVASAGHELRTPLTLLHATAEVALRPRQPDPAEQTELWRDVLQETDHMTKLVEDLLLLSRLDAGRLPLERGPVDAAGALGDVARQAGRLAEERGVRLEVRAAEGTADADPTRLRQVLLILIDNALRHTPAGGEVRLAATRQGHRVRFSVEDTGSGIAPEHLPRVFERFYVANPARGREGAGLGLSIARALVEAHGGAIAAHSTPGQGTRVEFWLPAVAARQY